MKNPNKIKLKDWNHLTQVGIKLNTEVEQYIIPMGAHGLPNTKVTLDAEDEIKQELHYHDENKFSRVGSIMLIGTEY